MAPLRRREDAARAIGLCKFTTKESGEWGVISARFTGADGSGSVAEPRLMTGMLPNFGVVQPKEGHSLLALSSGVARAVDQAGYTPDCDILSAARGTPPDGYPKDSSTCGAGVFSDLPQKAHRARPMAAGRLPTGTALLATPAAGSKGHAGIASLRLSSVASWHRSSRPAKTCIEARATAPT